MTFVTPSGWRIYHWSCPSLFKSGFALSITVLNIQCPSQENVAGIIHCMAHDVVSPRENSMMPRREQDSAVILHVAIPADIVL
jgi:hypothetical protein